jgi:hypothetical protein
LQQVLKLTGELRESLSLSAFPLVSGLHMVCATALRLLPRPGWLFHLEVGKMAPFQSIR